MFDNSERQKLLAQFRSEFMGSMGGYLTPSPPLPFLPESMGSVEPQVDIEVPSIKELTDEMIKEMDNILGEAVEIANEEDTELAKKMQSAGFLRSKTIEKFRKSKLNMSIAKDTRKLADIYAQKFPKFLFIKGSAILKVVNKYGLAFRGASKFEGEMPRGAMKDIADFPPDIKSYEREGDTGIEPWMVLAPEDQFEEEPDRNDPLVFRSVKGGFLLVAAWGPEADYIEELK